MLSINGQPITPQHFPDGTLRLNIAPAGEKAEICWQFENNEEMAVLYFAVNHLREHGTKQLTLYMPYIPNARMDRVKNEDEVFTLKYFAQFINALQFDRVVVRDPHSAVSQQYIERMECEDIRPVIAGLCDKLLTEKDVAFFPDAGSCKRYAGYLTRPFIYGVKERDWKSGKILGLRVEGNVPPAPFNALIIDDISSYGGTFYHSAKKLKELGADKIWLYVTHCENSVLDGELIKSGLVEKIYTTRSVFTQEHPLVEII
jgi:ribose-phosphate pyrophosphokinase